MSLKPLITGYAARFVNTAGAVPPPCFSLREQFFHTAAGRRWKISSLDLDS
jgi:hypothetical protein